MDDNTRQVAIAIVGVISTLSGIGLGWVLQGLRRHDEARRSAYSKFVAATRQMMAGVLRAAEEAAAGTGNNTFPDALAREVWETFGLIQIIGGKHVMAAAQDVQRAMAAWVAAGGTNETRSPADEALKGFLEAARSELG